MGIDVLHPGMASSFQDCGRYGFQQSGVPVSGAMDRYSHRLANLLVGNQQDNATLEITLSGPTLRFTQQAMIALCGANLSPVLNGEPLLMQQAVKVEAGSVLSFGKPVHGIRAYLAVSGGFLLPEVMNSQSTCLVAGFGGFAGRYLQKGDQLSFSRTFRNSLPVTLPFGEQDLFNADQPIRVVSGRHWHFFEADVQQQFLEENWLLRPESNRMGFRLQGDALLREVEQDIHSEAVDMGTIQIPADGQPIVLMADGQTTGGYPKIAHVISVDLPRLAQMAPGTRFRFQLISLEQAQQLAVEQERWFRAISNR